MSALSLTPVESDSLSLIADRLHEMSRAEIGKALRDHMFRFRRTVPQMSQLTGYPRTILRDLLMDRPAMAEPVTPDECARMRFVMIHGGSVYTFQWDNTEQSLDGFELMKDYYTEVHPIPDVYMSLENVNGVTIREWELRNGKVYRDMDGSRAV